jgi:hypothetical protein
MTRMRGDQTKYGMPPEGGIVRPIEPPWDAHLQLLVGLWLEGRCKCGRRLYSLRQLAGDVGWTQTLRTVVPRLRCKTCEERPTMLKLIDDPTAGAPGRIGPPGRWELLLDRPPA